MRDKMRGEKSRESHGLSFLHSPAFTLFQKKTFLLHPKLMEELTSTDASFSWFFFVNSIWGNVSGKPSGIQLTPVSWGAHDAAVFLMFFLCFSRFHGDVFYCNLVSGFVRTFIRKRKCLKLDFLLANNRMMDVKQFKPGQVRLKPFQNKTTS